MKTNIELLLLKLKDLIWKYSFEKGIRIEGVQVFKGLFDNCVINITKDKQTHFQKYSMPYIINAVNCEEMNKSLLSRIFATI